MYRSRGHTSIEQTLQFADEADSTNVAVCGVNKGLSIVYAVLYLATLLR